MKKILIIFAGLFLLTGCTVKYEVSINNGKFKEKLNVKENDSTLFDKTNDSGWTLRELFNPEIYLDKFSKEDYSIESLSDKNHLEIIYKSNELASAINSSILNQCYSDPIIQEEDNIIRIETGNNFECYEYYDYLEDIEIRFKTNHKVILTNADSVEDDVYIWNINKNSNKNIIITYDKTITYNKYKTLLIIGSAGVLVVTGLYIYFIIKRINKRNKI